ncbi:MAG TPA: nuclear transport factor 2 family protein, partial [Gammaproteobacteria bacterium]|nr:nuclear transport factor 2 family protein [Gammaproteobacteria bacterium]
MGKHCGKKACRAAAAAFLALVVAAAAAGIAVAAKRLPYPDIADTSHASHKAAQICRGFFTAKSAHDADALMTYFAHDPVLYIDASSGNEWPTRKSLSDVFHRFLPSAKPDALSYPLRIIGDEHSAVVEFEDMPALFGRELRIIGSVTFDDQGHIVRWIDYWDGRSSLRQTSIQATYPTDFRDNVVNASPKIMHLANELQKAFSDGDAAAAAALFSFDASFEDMAAHTRLVGQLQIERYLSRALAQVPYGKGASVAHVVGSDQGGGYEWHASPSAAPMRRGNTALELDADGKITRFTTVYDSGLFSYEKYKQLVLLGAEE